ADPAPPRPTAPYRRGGSGHPSTARTVPRNGLSLYAGPSRPLKKAAFTSSSERTVSFAAVGHPVEPVQLPSAAEGDQLHLAILPWLKPHRRAGRNVEMHPKRPLALEPQRAIDLEEVIVRTDLNRPVARVGDAERDRFATGSELDLTLGRDYLAGDGA